MGLIDRIRTLAARSAPAKPTQSPPSPRSHVAAPPTDPCAEGDRLLAQGLPERAIAAYQAAVDASGSAAAHVGQARAYLALGRTQDAVDSLEVALALDEHCQDALDLLAAVHTDCGDAQAAADLLRAAVALAPGRADLRFRLGLVLNRIGATDAAMDQYREAIELDPGDPAARINLGLIYLQQKGDPLAAEEHLRKALRIAPGHVAALANLGLALQDQDRYEEALELYRDGLRQHPDNVELRWNEAIAHLSRGDYARGWPGYEMRLARPDGRKLDRFPYAPWDGKPLRGGLLVLAEQGIGDEIMFASCLPNLRERVGSVALECSPRLAGLFARSFPGIAVHGLERGAAFDWPGRHPELQAKAAIGSLPGWLRTSSDAFPGHRGYLVPDPVRVRRWRDRLDALGSSMKVGISWRGGSPKTRGPLRSVDLAALQPLLALEAVRFVSIQHEPAAEESERARTMNVAVWEEATADCEDTAALIAALDLVITVANTNAHLAGALGKRAWVLLNDSPEWRWLRAGNRSPWYPSLELMRPAGRPWWDATVNRLAGRLREESHASGHAGSGIA